MMIDHILRFERLSADFNALMKKYGLAARLDGNHRVNVARHENGRQTFQPANLTAETNSLIRRHYQKDFEYFDYDLREEG